jgi:hypothetical protein
VSCTDAPAGVSSTVITGQPIDGRISSRKTMRIASTSESGSRV